MQPTARATAAAVDGPAQNIGTEYAGKGMANPPRTYRCQRWPFFAMGEIVKFNQGLFTATTDAQVRLIEGSSDFSAGIITRSEAVDGSPARTGL